MILFALHWLSWQFSLYLLCILSFPRKPSPPYAITHSECTLKRICSPKKVGICKATDRFKCQLRWCTVGTLSYKVVRRGHLRETNTQSFTPSAAWTLYGPTVAVNVTVNHLSSWQPLQQGALRSSNFIQIAATKKETKNLVSKMPCHVQQWGPIPALFKGLKLITARGENYTSVQGWWMTS